MAIQIPGDDLYVVHNGTSRAMREGDRPGHREVDLGKPVNLMGTLRWGGEFKLRNTMLVNIEITSSHAGNTCKVFGEEWEIEFKEVTLENAKSTPGQS